MFGGILLPAALPAILLLLYIYKKDVKDKEPRSLLWRLFLLGGMTIVTAFIAEVALQNLFGPFLATGSAAALAVENFLFVALVEELGKYVVLRKVTWKSEEFNYTFDAVVYAVASSLGFATFENVLYLIGADFSVAIARGLLSVPGHAIDGVFMGAFYGRAKKCEAEGDLSGKSRNLFLALLVPTLLHGFYDFCLSMESDVFLAAFFIFEIAVTAAAIVMVNRLSKDDRMIMQGFGGSGFLSENIFEADRRLK
ncbi:MAG: PrsW family intramembrane metalloprotease [Lachnospiraceae bacterium]|nr:PrsW family intramembrane metalloprotease [Lachnospiraceae bacterium]